MELIELSSTKRIALATAAVLVFSAACAPRWRLVQQSPSSDATSPSANSGQGPGAGMLEPPSTQADGTRAQPPAASNAPSVTNGAAPIASVGDDTPFASAILDHPGVKLPDQGPWTVSFRRHRETAQPAG